MREKKPVISNTDTFSLEYECGKRNQLYPIRTCLPLSTNAGKETIYIQYGHVFPWVRMRKKKPVISNTDMSSLEYECGKRNQLFPIRTCLPLSTNAGKETRHIQYGQAFSRVRMRGKETCYVGRFFCFNSILCLIRIGYTFNYVYYYPINTSNHIWPMTLTMCSEQSSVMDTIYF